jgi:hypothetical protein
MINMKNSHNTSIFDSPLHSDSSMIQISYLRRMHEDMHHPQCGGERALKYQCPSMVPDAGGFHSIQISCFGPSIQEPSTHLLLIIKEDCTRIYEL